MNDAHLLIGSLVERTGRSVHTIRWYERQGLVPGVQRDAGGRRRYSELHVGWLLLMDRLRRTGMSIAEMREYTALVQQGKVTLKQRQAMLKAHRERVQRTIAEWTQALTLLDDKIDFYGTWISSGKRPRLDTLAVASSATANQPPPKGKTR
jgi:DNA-binding transcriptional MerR regulator